MPDQPALGDGQLNPCPVFVGVAAGAQEWIVDQLDGDALIPVGLGRVGELKELARSFVGIGEGSISGEFHLTGAATQGEHGRGILRSAAGELQPDVVLPL